MYALNDEKINYMIYNKRLEVQRAKRLERFNRGLEATIEALSDEIERLKNQLAVCLNNVASIENFNNFSKHFQIYHDVLNPEPIEIPAYGDNKKYHFKISINDILCVINNTKITENKDYAKIYLTREVVSEESEIRKSNLIEVDFTEEELLETFNIILPFLTKVNKGVFVNVMHYNLEANPFGLKTIFANNPLSKNPFPIKSKTTIKYRELFVERKNKIREIQDLYCKVDFK